jgi:D-glycero-alpha-D-manno-heptose-7-phosphate kinase
LRVSTLTPLRISFVGGGSDLPGFYLRSPGAVLSTTINRYVRITSDSDATVAPPSQGPAGALSSPVEGPILGEALRRFPGSGNLTFRETEDVAAGTGLGMSSSRTVGLLHNLHARFHASGISRQALAEEAWEVETAATGRPIGKQDQYAASIGGMNVFRFRMDGCVDVEPVRPAREVRARLEACLMLFYTGVRRDNGDILERQNRSMARADASDAVRHMVLLVDALADSLRKGDVAEVGRLLHEDWSVKRGLVPGITNPLIDGIYETATRNGAGGGKLLGAGGGGYMLLYCEPEAQRTLRKSLAPLVELRFRFGNRGSRVDRHEKFHGEPLGTH